eukprot:1810476-Amphidinium_carterae.1
MAIRFSFLQKGRTSDALQPSLLWKPLASRPVPHWLSHVPLLTKASLKAADEEKERLEVHKLRGRDQNAYVNVALCKKSQSAFKPLPT